MADCHDCEGKEIGENQQDPVVPENHGLPEMQNVKVAQNSQMRKMRGGHCTKCADWNSIIRCKEKFLHCLLHFNQEEHNHCLCQEGQT